MIRNKTALLMFSLIAGMLLPWSGAIAQDKEHVRPFKNLPPQERRQAVQQLRQERAQNPEKAGPPQRSQPPEKLQQREELRARAGERARQADTNRDGALSRDEAGKSMPRFSRHFDEADTNGDGIVTREELRAFREKRRQQRQGRGDGDPRN